MAIKFRRGNKADLQVSELQQGEPVVALDTKEFGIKGREGDMIWTTPANRLIAGIPLQNDISKTALLESLSLTQPELIKSLGVSNRNLLHNWDFKNPVNQRGQTDYTGSGIYTIDRWHTGSANMRVQVFDEYIGVEGNDFFSQVLEGKMLYGKTLTVSIKLHDGTIITGTGVLPSESAAWEYVVIANTQNILLVFQNYNGSHFQFGIINNTAGQMQLVSAKLELGSVSTLANDTPADYGEQLLICQRYYRVCNVPQVPILYSGVYKNTVYFDPPMRGTPVVTPVVSNLQDGNIGSVVVNSTGYHWGVFPDSANPAAVHLAGYTADANL